MWMSAIRVINTTQLSSANVGIIGGFAQYYASVTFEISHFTASLDLLQGFGALTGMDNSTVSREGPYAPLPSFNSPFHHSCFCPILNFPAPCHSSLSLPYPHFICTLALPFHIFTLKMQQEIWRSCLHQRTLTKMPNGFLVLQIAKNKILWMYEKYRRETLDRECPLFLIHPCPICCLLPLLFFCSSCSLPIPFVPTSQPACSLPVLAFLSVHPYLSIYFAFPFLIISFLSCVPWRY